MNKHIEQYYQDQIEKDRRHRLFLECRVSSNVTVEQAMAHLNELTKGSLMQE